MEKKLHWKGVTTRYFTVCYKSQGRGICNNLPSARRQNQRGKPAAGSPKPLICTPFPVQLHTSQAKAMPYPLETRNSAHTHTTGSTKLQMQTNGLTLKPQQLMPEAKLDIFLFDCSSFLPLWSVLSSCFPTEASLH